MTIGVAIHWKFRAVGTVDLFEFADRVTEALLELELSTPTVLDSAVSADRGQRVVEIEVSASGQSEDEAVATGQVAVQSAITAAGGEFASLLPTDLHTTRLAPA